MIGFGFNQKQCCTLTLHVSNEEIHLSVPLVALIANYKSITYQPFGIIF